MHPLVSTSTDHIALGIKVLLRMNLKIENVRGQRYDLLLQWLAQNQDLQLS